MNQIANEGCMLTNGDGLTFTKEVALGIDAPLWYEVPETFTGKIAPYHIDKPIRLIITHEQNTAILTSPYGETLYDYFNANNLVRFTEPEGIYIYLNKLELEHWVILKPFGVMVQIRN